NSMINFLSSDFDPEAALSADRVTLPFPAVTPLDNLSQCRRLLPESAAAAVQDERHLRAGSKHSQAPKLQGEGKTAEGDEGAATSAAMGASEAEPKLSLNAQWATRLTEGPLRLLRRLQHARVRVIVRRQYGLRSACEGQLVTFDRHFNLVLRGVRERAVVQPAVSSLERACWPRAQWQDRCYELLTPHVSRGTAIQIQLSPPLKSMYRSLGQLLVRGDCVVCVSVAPCDAQPLAAREAFRKLAARAARRAIVEREIDHAARLNNDKFCGAATSCIQSCAASSTGHEESADGPDPSDRDLGIRGLPEKSVAQTLPWDGLSESTDESESEITAH
ncbi:MAG: hypothetical protein SGPRY_003657, partial [Prymnesium sp.]